MKAKRIPFVAVTIILVASLAALLVARSQLGQRCGWSWWNGSSSRGGVSRYDHRITFDTFERYMASEERSSSERHQVVFIGLDGASWDIIDPLIAAGKLPTLQKLKQEGASGILRSTDCYFSPPAWTTMMSGYDPEKSGIYTFGKWDRAAQEFDAVSSMDVEVPCVWDVASQAGKRVAVTNVPVTYPAHALNGLMVTGLMTPIVFEATERTYSRRLRPLGASFDATRDDAGYSPALTATFPMSVSTVVAVLYDLSDDGEVNYDTASLKVFPTGERWQLSDDVPITRLRLGSYSPWFTMDYRKSGHTKREKKKVSLCVNLKYSDTPDNTKGAFEHGRAEMEMSPLLRVPTDPDLRLTYPEAAAADIEKRFGNYIVTLNFNRDLIVSTVDRLADYAMYFYNYDDWDLFFYVFQAPDNIQHREGFSSRTEIVYKKLDRFLARLMTELPDDVTLIVASDHGFARYKNIIDMNRYFESLDLFDGIATADFDSTLVFSNQWCLYFNDDLLTESQLHRRGIPTDGYETPRDALIAYLHQKAKEIKDPETGRAMPVELIDVPKSAAGRPPDMIITGTYSDYFVEGTDLRIMEPQVVRPADVRTQWYHHRNGIYIMWGHKIRRGDGGVRSIADITPTILYLLGLPLATDFDGNVMRGVIDASVLARENAIYVKNYSDLAYEFDFTYDELETLEEKLRTLGYMR